jgi:hypothetical protein
MTVNNTPTRVLRGEILPRERSDVQLPPNTPIGIPFLARAKYWAFRRALESYADAVRAQEQAFRALAAREQAREEYELILVRAEKIDVLREAERLKVDNELALVKEEAQLRALRHRTATARLEVEAIVAEQRLEELQNKRIVEAKADLRPTEQAKVDMEKIHKDMAEMKRWFNEFRGGENSLTDEDRDFLVQIDLKMNHMLQERLENL